MAAPPSELIDYLVDKSQATHLILAGSFDYSPITSGHSITRLSCDAEMITWGLLLLLKTQMFHIVMLTCSRQTVLDLFTKVWAV